MLNADKDTSLIASIDACSIPLKEIEDLRNETLLLKRNMEISREMLIGWLNQSGYKKVSIVVEKGEFSARNYILDIFSVITEEPVRIEFFGDEIDSIRLFSVDDQRTIKNIDEVTLLPLKQSDGDKFIQEILNFTKIFITQSAIVRLSAYDEAHNCSTERSERSLKSKIRSLKFPIVLSTDPINSEGVDGGAIPITGLGIYPDERKSIDDLVENIKGLKKNATTMIVSPTLAQAERIKDIFLENSLPVPVIMPEKINTYTGDIFITTGELSEGLFITGLIILTDREIFGELHRYRSITKSSVSNLLQSMDDLTKGDYVVHNTHGIGIFEGLKRMITEGFEADMLIMRYTEDARLYLPVYGIGSIKKYHAEEGVIPALDRLGGKTWQRVKKKVRKKVEFLARKLINLYAKRDIHSGFQFSEDTDIHREFDNFFPYEETPDQISAMQEIKVDMESERPMDRLLCGDVGYGKTEVAMRAAFKTVYDGKQVVILVPTTILCEQHYITFKERFSAFPVTIDYLSRFKTRKANLSTIEKLSKGEIDMIIGTHTILRKDMDIPNLGLLVIDEEHRFGVSQKERIKELKTGIDFLSLSATPIPRTLQMALTGIWNMSTIETPPEERLSVLTFISTFNKEIIRESIEREVSRGGQVFFVHNRIKTIENMVDMLKGLVPYVSIAMAHGQMKERELEKIMIEFMKRKIDVLVSTSIIGSGIDIPTANTIIINRADKIGLADLYQLRGRVGRSNVKAYAYLLIPGDNIITDKARKRLTAIHEHSYLGAGLRLAMKDLEIRGAGNLLGPEQSGHIHAVGFDTYMEMLEEEISNIKGIPVKKEVEPVIDLKIEALIPDSYIEDVSLRLNFYRRIAVSKEEAGLFSLEEEMSDRFGGLPQKTENLFTIMRIKLLCKQIKALSVEGLENRIKVTLLEDTPVEVKDILLIKGKSDYDLKLLENGFMLFTEDSGESEVLRDLIDLLKSIG